MSVLSKIKVYATQPHPCSYLDDQEATTLFIDPTAKINNDSYGDLSKIGFRRSGSHYYRPHCQSCNSCVPVRVPTQSFIPTRRHKRILSKNRDLKITEVAHIDSDEHYQLYEKYISERHSDGDMYPASEEQYRQFLVEENRFARYTEFRLGSKLIAVSVTDNLPDSLSAIYTYFDPEHEKRSLGSFIVLWLIQFAQEKQLHHVYLGYWIQECRKMSYKIDYRPVELRLNGRWQLLA